MSNSLNIGGAPASLEQQFETAAAEQGWSFVLGLGHMPAAAGGSTTTLEPTAGRISVRGKTATLSHALRPSSGRISVRGNTASITQAIAPSRGRLSINGKTPSLTRAFAPSVGHLALRGKVSSLSIAIVREPTAGRIAVRGKTPALRVQLAPQGGRIRTAGHPPRLELKLAPSTGGLRIMGHVPVLAHIAPERQDDYRGRGGRKLKPGFPDFPSYDEVQKSWEVREAYNKKRAGRPAERPSAPRIDRAIERQREREEEELIAMIAAALLSDE